jgi:hypothetical protein
MVLGGVIMLLLRPSYKAFFARKPETATPGVLDAPVERAPAHLMGREHVTTDEHWLTPEDAPPAEPPRDG